MMRPITTERHALIPLAWSECSRFLAALLTSDAWSGERAHLVGRTQLRFVVATRAVEASERSLLFRVIGDSPDLRHPVAGSVEAREARDGVTALTVRLEANLDAEAERDHRLLREGMTSLAETLLRTISTAIDGAA